MEPIQISVLFDSQIDKILPRGLAVGAGLYIEEMSEVDNELKQGFQKQ